MFQEIVDQSQIAVVISDYDTRTIIYANDSVRQILEIPQRVELIGQPTAVLYSQGESLISREELSEFNAESFWERDIYTTKGKYLKLKGREVLWANRHTYAIYIIDETKEQELIHNVPGGLTIMELNVSGSCKVTFANNSWLKMMDTTWQVFERVYARDYFGWIHPKDRDMVKREIITNWGKSKISVEPFRVKTTRGQIIYLTANLTLRNIDGSNAQYYCVFTDITSQIAARRVLEEAQKRLNIIQSNSNLLIWEIDFQRNVLIPDRHSARVFHTTKQEYPYPEIIRDVDAFDSKTKTEILDFIHSFQKGEEVDNLEILIRMTLASQNSCYLVGRLRFNQIFFNLLSNAVKYTPEGREIYLYTERIPSIEENKTGIRYHIKDNGIGMSEEFQERIFEPFEQEYNDIVNNSQGTGLGTTIVKRIVDAMGGDI